MAPDRVDRRRCALAQVIERTTAPRELKFLTAVMETHRPRCAHPDNEDAGEKSRATESSGERSPASSLAVHA